MTTDAARGLVLQATARRGWRTTVVIPRELCLFESLPCAGVAWHELGSFARVQAARLAPYVSSGASAAVRHKTMMMWFWDESEVNAALQSQGLDPAKVDKIAETLMLALPGRQGEFRQACSGGTDVLTLSGGAIVASSFSPHPTPLPAPLLARPWARDRLHLTAYGKVATAWMPAHQLLGAASAVAVVACGAYAAYWGGMVLGAQQRLTVLEQEAARSTAALGNVNQWRSAEKADRQWVESYRSLGASLQFDALLHALEAPLVANGLAIKELDVRSVDARLLLVSVGPEIDLPATLAALGRVPGVEDVQLRAGIDPQQALYSMRVPGYRSLSAPSGAPGNELGRPAGAEAGK